MKFSIIALATVASASSIVQRDFAQYQKVFDAVNTGITGVDTAVTGFSGDKQPLLDAAASLVKTLKDGKTSVDGFDKLGDDALQLAGPVGKLNSAGTQLVNDLKSKRDTVQKVGECATVRKSIGDINSSSQDLIKAVIAKVPEQYQSIANTLAGQLTATLNKAQDDFSEANCKDSTGGASSSAGPTGGSSSAAPTSAKPTGGSSAAPTSAPATSAPTSAKPSGSGAPPASTSAPVTAGAASYAPAGALAMAIAALVL